MYPLVEFLTGLLFLGSYLAFGLTYDTAKVGAFSAILVVFVFTDLRERILPDVVNYTGFAIRAGVEPVHEADRRHCAVDRESAFSRSLLRRRSFR